MHKYVKSLNANFHSDGVMSEKYLHFRKQQKHVPRNLFSPSRSNWIHVP